MSIIFEHLPFYREIFNVKGFWKEPFLLIGIPRMDGVYLPRDFYFRDLKEKLESDGINKVYTLDYFDKNADFLVDLNKPVPPKLKNRFKVVFDMGSVEHVFDTKQCLVNYFSMIKKDGLFVLVTVVNGYFGHGFHVFNPEAILEALKLNGFEILYLKYSTSTGIKLSSPNVKKNVIMWLVASKKRSVNKFVVPQQKEWGDKYKKGQSRTKPTFKEKAKFVFRQIKQKLTKFLPDGLRSKLYGG